MSKSRYCSAADLRALVPDLYRDAALADSFGGANADPGLLDIVLSSACDEVDALISGRVRLPLPADAIPSKLRTAAALIAAETLYIRRGTALPEALAAKVKWWRDWLSKVGEGDLRLAASSESDDEASAASAFAPAAITARPAVTGSHGLLGAIALLLSLGAALLPGSARAAVGARTWELSLPQAEDMFASPADLEWVQGESVQLVYFDAPGADGTLRWELADATNVWLAAAPAATGSGQWAWHLSPTQSCLPVGRYAGRIAAYVQEGTNLVFHRVHALQSVRVHASPWGDLVPSEPIATNVQAWVRSVLAGYTPTSALATASNTLSARIAAESNRATGAETALTNALAAYATTAELAAESNRATGAEAALRSSVTAASNALSAALAAETTRATNRETAIEGRFADYATSASMANALAGYATTTALAVESNRATAAETALRSSITAASNAIPARVSQLENDAGYLSQHQSLSGLATASALESATNAIAEEVARATAAETALEADIEALAATHADDTGELWEYSRDTASKLLVVEALLSDTNGTTLANAFEQVAENTADIADLSRDLDARAGALAQTQAVHTVQIGQLAKIAGLDGTYFVQPDHNYYFGADFDLTHSWLLDPSGPAPSSYQEVWATTCAVSAVSVTGATVAATIGRAVSSEPAVAWAFDASGDLDLASGTGDLDCWISWPPDADTNLSVTVAASLDGTGRSLSIPVATLIDRALLFSGFVTGTVQHAWATNMEGLVAAEGCGTSLYLAEGEPWTMRDPACWGAVYDFSCVSVANYGSTNADGAYYPHFPVTLVASNVGVIASHVLSATMGIPADYLSPSNPDYERNRRTPTNAPIVFADGMGNCYTSRVPYGFNPDGTFYYHSAPFGDDGRLVRLDPPLPDDIVPALLLSPTSGNRYWGGDVADRNDYAAGTDIAFVAQGLQLYAARAYLNPKHPPARGSWFGAKTADTNLPYASKRMWGGKWQFAIEGDSGSPVFALPPETNRPVLLWAVHTGDGSGPDPAARWDAFLSAYAGPLVGGDTNALSFYDDSGYAAFADITPP